MTGTTGRQLTYEDLERRLGEAEETLRAIRDGEADAVVLRHGDGDKVFALGGGDESYRAIMEAMDIGAIALDADGSALYANGALCDLLGCAAAELQTRGLWPYLDPAVAEPVRHALAGSGDQPFRSQFAQPLAGKVRHLAVTVAPLPLGFGTGSVVTFTDVSARVEADRASESSRIARAVISSANQAVVVCDRAGKVVNANTAAVALVDEEPLGRQFDDAFPLLFPVSSPILFGDDLVRMASEGNEVQGLEAQVPHAAGWTDLLVSAAPLRLAAEKIGGSVVTLVDNSERKAAEKHQSLLLRELDHRVKNSLAVVMSIASRTGAHATDIADFRNRFNSRLQALAATHVLLAEAAWNGVRLSALVQRELAPFTASAGPKLVVEGLDHEVSPDVGIAFGMVIHELTTNAVKYGALSTETGTVAIVGHGVEGGIAHITWTERGGPPVGLPQREGFGQTLIARSLNRGNGGGARVSFDPVGVVCTMTVPVV